MYLIHFAMLYFLAKINFVDYIPISDAFSAIVNFGIRYIILLVITVLISSISYKIVEIPFQNLGRKVIKKGSR